MEVTKLPLLTASGRLAKSQDLINIRSDVKVPKQNEIKNMLQLATQPASGSLQGISGRHIPANQDDQALLKRLREERVLAIRRQRKVDAVKGPRLQAGVAVDRVAFAALQRSKAKKFVDNVRVATADSENQKKKRQKGNLVKKTQKKSFSEFNLSDYRIGSGDLEKVNNAFELFLGFGDGDVATDNLMNPEELLSLMPIRKRGQIEILEKEKLSNIISYNLPKANVTVDELSRLLPGSLITKEDKVIMEQKHQRLLSSIQMPQHLSQTLVSIHKHQMSKSESVIDAEEKEEQTGSNFWLDHEILLERQVEFQQEAISSLGRIENEINGNTIIMSRFGKSDVASLIWNMSKHLSGLQERLLSEEKSLLFYQAVRTSGGDDGKCAVELKKVLKELERKKFLEMKSFVGHARRIALISYADSKLGMQQLARRISSAISPLIFESRFQAHEEDRLQKKPGELTSKLSRGEIFNASLIDPEAPVVPVFESDVELMESWKYFNGSYFENILLESEVPLSWHSRALDVMIRFYDFIVKT